MVEISAIVSILPEVVLVIDGSILTTNILIDVAVAVSRLVVVLVVIAVVLLLS